MSYHSVIWIVNFSNMVYTISYFQKFSKDFFSKLVSMLEMEFFVEIFLFTYAENDLRKDILCVVIQNSTIPVTYKGPVFFFSIFAVSKIVLSLIFTDKKSTPECSPSNSPFLKSRSPDNAVTSASSVTGTQVDSANNLSSLNSLPVLNGGQPETEVVPDGLAPIAKTEEMSDDLSEETLVNGESNPNSSTPIKKGSDWRLTNGNGSVVNKSLASGDLPWWSEEDDDEKTDRKASLCNGNGNKNNHSAHSVEDGFESFSCTDEEDEGDRLSLDSNSTSR